MELFVTGEGHSMIPLSTRRLRSGRSRRRGFTLVELIFSMGIIVILAMLLMGAVIHARKQARDATCKGNLSQLWKSVNLYANNHDDFLFVNTVIPLQISNTIYSAGVVTGFGYLYSNFLPDHRSLFCTNDPVRDPNWEYGLHNWQTATGEVRVSYGYRGRQGFTEDPAAPLTLGMIDREPGRLMACDFYGGPTAPPNQHHEFHTNVLRGNGKVEQVKEIPRIGHDLLTAQQALDILDR